MPVALSITVALLALFALALVMALRRRRAQTAKPAPASSPPAASPATAPRENGSGAGGLPAREAWTALHRLALTAPRLEPQIPPGHERVAAQVAEDIGSDATRASLPRRPLLLPQLLRAVNDPETSRRELAGIIARDPALAGDLLRLANSPFYRLTAKPVESIDRAVAVLGTEGLRRLVAAAIMQPVFRVRTGHFSRFPDTTWDHAFRAGIAAETFAALVDDSDPFAAQLLALLLGLGAIIVFRAAMERYVGQGGLAPSPELIALLIDTQAPRAAHAVAASWELSQGVLTAITEQREEAAIETLSPLGRSVRLGRLTGALAVVRTGGGLTDEAALATLHAAGAPARQSERIWLRLVPESAATLQKTV
ncbi:MAG TPA: HDOD domain-containing protein [Steroidobacteraceae bacterium]|nr:HDOD domain-containing protein [Steroidobacteraceae bacterium]